MTTKKTVTTKAKSPTKKSVSSEVEKKAKKTPVKKDTAKQAAVSVAPKKTKTTMIKKIVPSGSPVKVQKKAAAKKKTASADESKTKLSPEERYRMVETAAYFIAERNGFQGDSTAHWAAAEVEIAAMLRD